MGVFSPRRMQRASSLRLPPPAQAVSARTAPAQPVEPLPPLPALVLAKQEHPRLAHLWYRCLSADESGPNGSAQYRTEQDLLKVVAEFSARSDKRHLPLSSS